MPSQERPSFFFYNRGYHPKELKLGHLVYGSYGAPTQERNISAGQLTKQELDEYAISQTRLNCCLTTKRVRGFDAAINASDLVELGIHLNWSTDKVVVSKLCRRIHIQQPEAFLNDVILKNQAVVTALRKWTDLRNTNYVTRYVEKGRVRTPSIWMLTGLYELEDATSLLTEESTISPSVGVGAEILALLGVPVGGSIGAEHGRSSSSGSTLPGVSIWAAQYKLLDLRYVRVSKDQILPPLTLPVELRSFTSKGHMMGGDDEAKQEETACAVEIALADATKSRSVDPDAYDRDFWERMDGAEKRWQHQE